jgi:hypothetical protein
MLLKELKRYVMNKERHIILLLFCCAHSSFPAIFDIGRPFTAQQKSWFPWNGFFNSMYALKELDTGKYPVKCEIGGYILHEPFWDSRQVDSLFEGLFLFAPKEKKCDPNGQDINATGQFNMAVIESRTRALLYGPKVLNAESFGYLEADFIGSDTLASRLRCRLAFLKLTWVESQVYMLTGLYYHPLRLAHIDLDPKVISHNVGAPLHPNVRAPQFKIAKTWKNNLHFECIALSEFDTTDFGPDGPSTLYVRRSLTPMMDVRLWIGPESTDHLIGVGFDIKRLMPRLVTDRCVRTRETLTSLAFDVYAKLTAEPLSVRTQFVWAQNAADYNMVGGYAVKCIDECTGKRAYTNFRTLSYWIDFNVDQKISPGLFGGYTKSLGSGSPIIPSITDEQTGISESLVYVRGANIAYMARLVPRIRFNVKPMVFGGELEWTRAGYGTLQSSGKITNVQSVSNIRFILASYFFF